MPAPQNRRPRARALAATGNRSLIGWTVALVLLLLLGMASQAKASQEIRGIVQRLTSQPDPAVAQAAAAPTLTKTPT